MTNGVARRDWEFYLITLKEVLEDVLFRIQEDESTGVEADISCLEAYDMLSQHIEAVKRELGIL